MTAGWQVAVYGAALILFCVAALAAWVQHRAWSSLLCLGLALLALVAVWNASAVD